MIVMGMTEHSMIDLCDVNSKLFHVFEEKIGRTGIQQDLFSVVHDKNGKAPFALNTFG